MKKSILFISFFVFGLALRAQHIDSIGFSMTQISLRPKMAIQEFLCNRVILLQI